MTSQTKMIRPVGPNTAAAIQRLAGGEREPGPDGYGLDNYAPATRFASLLGRCSSWNFVLQVAEGALLGGGAGGIDLFKAVQLPVGGTNPTGIVSPAAPAYADQVTYLLNNPAFLQGIRFSTSNTPEAIEFLQSVVMSVRAYSPQAGGYQETNSFPLINLLDPQQFQNQILDFLGQQVLDGYSYYNLSSPLEATGTFTISMLVLTGQPRRLADDLPDPGKIYSRFPGSPGSGGSQMVPTGRKT